MVYQLRHEFIFKYIIDSNPRLVLLRKTFVILSALSCVAYGLQNYFLLRFLIRFEYWNGKFYSLTLDFCLIWCSSVECMFGIPIPIQKSTLMSLLFWYKYWRCLLSYVDFEFGIIFDFRSLQRFKLWVFIDLYDKTFIATMSNFAAICLPIGWRYFCNTIFFVLFPT